MVDKDLQKCKMNKNFLQFTLSLTKIERIVWDKIKRKWKKKGFEVEKKKQPKINCLNVEN